MGVRWIIKSQFRTLQMLLCTTSHHGPRTSYANDVAVLESETERVQPMASPSKKDDGCHWADVIWLQEHMMKNPMDDILIWLLAAAQELLRQFEVHVENYPQTACKMPWSPKMFPQWRKHRVLIWVYPQCNSLALCNSISGYPMDLTSWSLSWLPSWVAAQQSPCIHV